MSNIDLPDWSILAINEVAKTNAWDGMIDDLEKSLLKSKKLEKRFSQYTEYEQAVLVEQEMKHLQLLESRNLFEFNRGLNAAVDDWLMNFIGNIVPSKSISSVQYLLNLCSQTIVRALESSPSEMASTAKLFLNRSIPDELRSHLWASALHLSKLSLDLASCPKISPSLDVLLARRCHLLLDTHFPALSSRAAAALLKTAVTDCMRFNGCPLPHDEDSSNFIGEYYEAHENDAQNTFDRLFFLAVPLSCVFPGSVIPPGLSSQDTKKASAGVSVSSSEDRRLPSPPDILSTKPHQMLESSLQTLLDARHLGLLLNSSDINDASLLANKPWRRVNADDADEETDSKLASEILRKFSPLLAVTKALILKKNPTLHEHILDLVTSEAVSKIVVERESVGSPRRVKNKVVTEPGMNFFYDVFMNECLLRGLSGLLPLDATQFVWDQCFIIGFSKMLPVILASLILGCGQELSSLTHTAGAVDTFSSFCRHSSIETLQRLLTNHAAPELRDMFDVEGMYVLEPDEDNDDLLRAVYKKMNTHGVNPDKERGNVASSNIADAVPYTSDVVSANDGKQHSESNIKPVNFTTISTAEQPKDRNNDLYSAVRKDDGSLEDNVVVSKTSSEDIVDKKNKEGQVDTIVDKRDGDDGELATNTQLT